MVSRHLVADWPLGAVALNPQERRSVHHFTIERMVDPQNGSCSNGP